MAFQQEMTLSFYKELSVLREYPKTALIQHIGTGRICVLKTLYMQSTDSLKQLQSTHVSGIPDLYSILDSSAKGNIDRQVQVIEEYISGDTLSDMLNYGLKPTQTVSIGIMVQLVEILCQLHRMDPPVVHSRINCHNIIVNSDAKVFLLNSGYSWGTDVDATPLQSNYILAPELRQSTASDIRSDIYACGILFNRLLTGQDMGGNINSKSASAIISKCIQPDPDDRYQNAYDLLTDLKSLKGN